MKSALLSSFVCQRWCSGMALRPKFHYMARLRMWSCAGCRAKRWIIPLTSLMNGQASHSSSHLSSIGPDSYNASLFTDNTTVNTTAGKQSKDIKIFGAKKKKNDLSWYHWVIDQVVDPQKLIGQRFDLIFSSQTCPSSPLKWRWIKPPSQTLASDIRLSFLIKIHALIRKCERRPLVWQC